MKTYTYIIYRHGANACNQGWKEEDPVAVIKAPNRKAAKEKAAEMEKAGTFTVFNNQWLEARAWSSCSRADQEEATEACPE